MSNLTKTSRRSVLRGLAVAPAALAGGSITGIPLAKAADLATSPDAELLALVERWRESQEISDRAFDRVEAITERMEHVPFPPALLYQPNDGPHMRYLSTDLEDGRRLYDFRTVEHLRANYVDARPNPYRTNEAGFRRAAEIVAAHDAREAEFERRCVVSGLRAAEAEHEELREIADKFRGAMASLPATTLEGVLAKAVVAADCAGGLESIVMDFEKEFREAPHAPNTVMVASLLVDLTRMAGGAA